MNAIFRSALMVSMLWNLSAYGQSDEGTSGKEKPEDAYIKIINASDTTQPERWKTGVDLKFKDKVIGSDIRLGERGPVGKISFTGRDVVEVFRHGDSSKALTTVPATLQRGGFYTLLVIGDLEATTADLKVLVIQEFPLFPTNERPGQCRVLLVNAVKDYPVALSVGKGAPGALAFGEQKEIFIPPGDTDLGLWFEDSKGERKRLQAGMIATSGANYTAVIHPSQERPDRPSFFRLNAAEDRKRVEEMESEEAKTPPPAPAEGV